MRGLIAKHTRGLNGATIIKTASGVFFSDFPLTLLVLYAIWNMTTPKGWAQGQVPSEACVKACPRSFIKHRSFNVGPALEGKF